MTKMGSVMACEISKTDNTKGKVSVPMDITHAIGFLNDYSERNISFFFLLDSFPQGVWSSLASLYMFAVEEGIWQLHSKAAWAPSCACTPGHIFSPNSQ